MALRNTSMLLSAILVALMFSSNNFILGDNKLTFPQEGGGPNNFTWHIISVSSKGKDGKACLDGTIPCKTIKYAISKGNLQNTKLVLSQEVHVLDSVLMLRFVSNFKLTTNLLEEEEGGKSNSAFATINCTKRNSGLHIASSRNIVLENTIFESCGAIFPSTNRDGNKVWNISTALYLKSFINISLLSVRITKSYGYGAVFYDVLGNVLLDSVYFQENRLISLYKESGLRSGGGIYIEFLPHCSQEKGEDYANLPSTYTFKNCHFIKNTAEYKTSLPSQSNCNQFISFGRGGGMSYMLRGNTTNTRLRVINSTFLHNTALFGGGIFIEFDDQAGNNSVTVEGTTFQSNIAFLAGGGIRCGINADGGKGFNPISVKHTKFLENFAKIGAGYSQYRNTHFGERIEKLTLDECLFRANSADRASAIHVALVKIELTSCVIENNTFHLTTDVLQGDGTIYCYGSQIHFFKDNKIQHNHFTALILEASKGVFYGVTSFLNNRGLNGGAISLYAEASIRLSSGAVLKFYANSASKRGGAIFKEGPRSSQGPMNSTELRMRQCFFHFGDFGNNYVDPDVSNTSTYFSGNSAFDASGQNIYATSISPCRRDNEPISNNSAFKWKTFHYGNDSASKTVVTSPIKLEIINAGVWNAYPGLTFSPELALYDENNNKVYGTVKVTVMPERKGHVQLVGSQLFVVKKRIPSIILLGSPGEVFTVTLETYAGPPLIERVKHLRLRECPPGYYFEQKSRRCLCVSNQVGLSYGVTRCEAADASVYVLHGRWANPRGTGKEFARHFCPRNYCKTRDTGRIDRLFRPNDQCEDGRNPNSTLCGECLPGKSVSFGDEKCQECDDSFGTFYLVLVVVVVALFVLLIMLVNVDTYSTSLNAFLYSYQIIPLCTFDNRTLDSFIDTAFSLINISGTGKMKLGVCLWESMDDLDKMLLNYLLPTVMILWTLIFTAISYHFDNKCTFNRRTTFRAFVFISVLAYSDFTRITFNLLHPVDVDGDYVLFIAGHIKFFSDRHLPYAIVALVVLIFIVILFPLILIFSHYIVGQPVFVKLMGVFDTFQEPFQTLPGYKFFSAFYFFNRVILLLIYTYVPHGCLQDTFFAILCVFILLVFVYVQPYKNKWMNRYDTLLLFNIAVMAVINTGLNGVVEQRVSLQTFAHVLAYFPLACLAVKLGIWLNRKVRDWQCRSNLRRRREQRQRSPFPERLHQEDDGYVRFENQP
eukprot:gene10018-11041_t